MQKRRDLEVQTKYHGSCLCRRVKFQVTGFSPQAANCHCTMCRKFHGAAFGTLVPVKELEWVSGLDLLKEYVAPNGTIRSFCGECGSSIGFRVKGADINSIELAIGTFDEDIPVEVNGQIYTKFKANWTNLHEGLDVYPEGR